MPRIRATVTKTALHGGAAPPCAHLARSCPSPRVHRGHRASPAARLCLVPPGSIAPILLPGRTPPPLAMPLTAQSPSHHSPRSPRGAVPRASADPSPPTSSDDRSPVRRLHSSAHRVGLLRLDRLRRAACHRPHRSGRVGCCQRINTRTLARASQWPRQLSAEDCESDAQRESRSSNRRRPYTRARPVPAFIGPAWRLLHISRGT